MLIVKSVIGIGFQLAFFAALMFGPIGTIDWPAAIIWLQLYAAMTLLSAAYLLTVRPAAIEARMRAGRQHQAPADRVAFGLMVLGLSVPFALAAKDSFDWHLLAAPSAPIQACGLVIFIIGFGIVILSMLANEFAAPTVHIQEAAGHQLADSGVYGHVRHPMYLGFLLFMVGTTLWLGSYAATAFALVFVTGSTVYRIHVEEAALSTGLPGYEAYKQRVTKRLLPFIY